VRQIDVSSFEKVQKAVKNRAATIEILALYRELSRAACRNVATAAEILEIRWKCCKPNRNKNLRSS
jgi:hypothetical protein